MVDAIRELTAVGSDELSEILGTLPFDAENVVKRLVTRAIERGIELQRAAILLENELVNTPLRPPPMSEVPPRTPRRKKDD
jgi:hypothetical protein